jgi:hypothetical protein
MFEYHLAYRHIICDEFKLHATRFGSKIVCVRALEINFRVDEMQPKSEPPKLPRWQRQVVR